MHGPSSPLLWVKHQCSVLPHSLIDNLWLSASSFRNVLSIFLFLFSVIFREKRFPFPFFMTQIWPFVNTPTFYLTLPLTETQWFTERKYLRGGDEKPKGAFRAPAHYLQFIWILGRLFVGGGMYAVLIDLAYFHSAMELNEWTLYSLYIYSIYSS